MWTAFIALLMTGWHQVLCWQPRTSRAANLSTQSALSEAESEGEAFTSSSQGLSCWSISTSYLQARPRHPPPPVNKLDTCATCWSMEHAMRRALWAHRPGHSMGCAKSQQYAACYHVTACQRTNLDHQSPTLTCPTLCSMTCTKDAAAASTSASTTLHAQHPGTQDADHFPGTAP